MGRFCRITICSTIEVIRFDGIIFALMFVSNQIWKNPRRHLCCQALCFCFCVGAVYIIEQWIWKKWNAKLTDPKSQSGLTLTVFHSFARAIPIGVPAHAWSWQSLSWNSSSRGDVFWLQYLHLRNYFDWQCSIYKNTTWDLKKYQTLTQFYPNFTAIFYPGTQL